MSRGLKQLTYGAGFLLFFSAVIFGVYVLVFKAAPTCFDLQQNGNETGIDCGGGCAPCAQKHAKDIEVGSVVKFSAGAAKTVIVAYLINPNDDYGMRDVVYTVEAKDANGAVLQTVSGHTFMYDRTAKIGRYLVVTIDVATKDIDDLAITFSKPVVVAKDEFIEPRVAGKQYSTDITGLKQITEPVYVFARDLGMKSTGDDVKKLEDFLYQKQLFKKLPDGTFDLDTKLALTAYQKAKKISPANGIFDAQTRARVNAEMERVNKLVVEPDGAVLITGNVKNDDVANASKVVITGLLYDASGIQLGGSKTELDNMEAGDEKVFKILFPKTVPIDKIDTTKTKVFVDSIK
jgi:hypothetical protein